MSGDLISRQDAIDAMYQLEAEDIETYGCFIPEGFHANQAVEALKILPAVEPERKWILCNAQMPEEREWIGTKRFGTTISDEVYVTFENPKGERFCKHLSFQNGKLSRYDQSTINAFYPEAKPIAWMPLPEPYYRGEW